MCKPTASSYNDITPYVVIVLECLTNVLLIVQFGGINQIYTHILYIYSFVQEPLSSINLSIIVTVTYLVPSTHNRRSCTMVAMDTFPVSIDISYEIYMHS